MKIKFNNLEIIAFFLIVGVSLFAASILVKKNQNITKKASSGQGSLSLPTQRIVEVDDEFNLPVMLDTGGESVIAVDVVINFNKSHLELIDIIPHPKTGSLEIFMPLNNNGDFQNSNVVNKANSEGEIVFGAAAFRWSEERVLGGFNGSMGPSNPLATLKFRTKTAFENSTVSFDFSKGTTTDSNLVSGTADILSQVTNGSISISGGCKPCPNGSFDSINTSSFNCQTNGKQNVDYGRWAMQYVDIYKEGKTIPQDELYGDYNCDGKLNPSDHAIWYSRWCPTEHSNCN